LGCRVGAKANTSSILEVLLNPVNTAELPVTVDFTARIGCQLFPSEKNGQVPVAYSFVRDAFGKVVSKDQRGEISNRCADRGQVADYVPSKARPDSLQAKWIA
jgi:hypothetical protein